MRRHPVLFCAYFGIVIGLIGLMALVPLFELGRTPISTSVVEDVQDEVDSEAKGLWNHLGTLGVSRFTVGDDKLAHPKFAQWLLGIFVLSASTSTSSTSQRGPPSHR